jgi:hypothetical protein
MEIASLGQSQEAGCFQSIFPNFVECGVDREAGATGFRRM